MNPDHPQWNQFVERMNNLKDTAAKKYPMCDRTFRRTRNVLETFSEIDVLATLQYFEAHETKCDCDLDLVFLNRSIFDSHPLTEEEDVESEIYFAIEGAFYYWRDQGLTTQQIKQWVFDRTSEYTANLAKPELELIQ